ncbi:MAG TPA: LPS export ABC transporter ATP-binding protein [Gemmatimonadales bacterium]|nr:LPS export ABC transporter ATP-binding protein [Gemmatimonadales bacterium]
MTAAAWLEPLAERDPSLPLALAALVHEADATGAVPFDQLVVAYRAAYEIAHHGTGHRSATPNDARFAPDGIADHLRQVLLPRMAQEGWVADDAAADWAIVRAAGPWWLDALRDRDTTGWRLLELGRRTIVDPRGDGQATPRRAQGSRLEAEALTKSFRGRRVVDDVGLELQQGEIVGLLGPNGAGKTTTFYMLTGLVRPDRGRVRLDGDDLTGAPMYQRARRGIGYLAQEPSVFRRMTVEENLRAVLETLPLDRAAREARLEALLGELSIRHLRDSRAYALSGGERRRLEITRALVTDPKFMLLDEPFAGVDPIAVHDIQTIVAGLRHRGIGVLITDHNVEQTLDIVDRAYIMYEGKVQAAGTVRELVFNDRVAQLYLGPTLTARLRARLESRA